MKPTTKNSHPLILRYIGEDFWSCPVYRDQFDHLWKDIELGNSKISSLYSVTNNEVDGEPLAPISDEYIIQEPREFQDPQQSFQYMMLGRLRSDCDYYLGYGQRNPKCLYENNEVAHIKAMKRIWNSFPLDKKPAWLTWDKILEYEKAMCKDQ